MDRFAENVALLYLLNQDTRDLSLEQLIVRYRETADEVKRINKELDRKENGDTYSFK